MDSAYPSMESSVASLESLPAETGRQKFPFFDLPAEIRLRIYEMLLVQPSKTIDLDPLNYRLVRPRLTCFLVCRRMHHEAYHVFYGAPQQPLRLYPITPRFEHTKKPLLTRIGPRNRNVVHTLAWNIGRGWSKPPRCWHTGPILGLADCTSLRRLNIMVELDPSIEFFNGFRGRDNTKDTYREFCLVILQSIFEQVPSLEVIELDGFPAVQKDMPIVQGLIEKAKEGGKRIEWGPQRGWRPQAMKRNLVGIEDAMAAMGI